MNYLLVDGNSLGYYHQQSDKLHNGEMEVQAVFGFVKNVRRYASILHARPMIPVSYTHLTLPTICSV